MYESYRRYHTLNYMDVYFSRASHRGKTVAEVAINTGIRSFEKWLEDNQDDLFAHAEGGNVEY